MLIFHIFFAINLPLKKLLWYQKGGESSDRQWRDVLGILLVRGDSLDCAYVDDTAATIHLAQLLERARREVSR